MAGCCSTARSISAETPEHMRPDRLALERAGDGPIEVALGDGDAEVIRPEGDEAFDETDLDADGLPDARRRLVQKGSLLELRLGFRRRHAVGRGHGQNQRGEIRLGHGVGRGPRHGLGPFAFVVAALLLEHRGEDLLRTRQGGAVKDACVFSRREPPEARRADRLCARDRPDARRGRTGPARSSRNRRQAARWAPRATIAELSRHHPTREMNANSAKSCLS